MNTLLDVLRQGGVPHRERGANVGREHINICCPVCHEARFHCGIHESKLWWHCWVCGGGGAWGSLRPILAARYPSAPWHLLHPQRSATYRDAPPRQLEVNDLTTPLALDGGHPVLAWLTGRPAHDQLRHPYRSRGIPAHTLADHRWAIGKGKLKGYVGIEEDGRLVARRYSEFAVGPRWWASPTDGKASAVLGVEAARWMNPPVGVITEGLFDWLRVPFGHAICLLGKGSAHAHATLQAVSRAFPSARELVLALDRDVDAAKLDAVCLELRDGGYGVRRVPWDAVSPDLGDLDEVALVYGEEGVRVFLGESFADMPKPASFMKS